jgi:hypothetical protein
LLGGCSGSQNASKQGSNQGSQKNADNVVAVVNGVEITEEDIETVITEKNIVIDIGEATGAIGAEMKSREELYEALGINPEAMTPAQKRFFENRDRSTFKQLTQNEALYNLLIQEVLYQEAVKQGHEVSIERAKEVMEDSKRTTLETAAQTEEGLKFYTEYYENADAIYQQYGFASEDDYLSQRIDRTAKAMAINSMQREFYRVMEGKLPNINVDMIERTNAWEDYGEYILSMAKVEILKPDYTIESYGEPWNHGKLELTKTAN